VDDTESRLKKEQYRMEEDEDRSPILCPRCKKGRVIIEQTSYKLPKQDETMLLMVVKCTNCDLLIRDVLPLETKIKPGTYTYRVTKGDLTAKIFRAPSGFLEIPEYGIEIEPGPEAEFIVTNVEGILERVISATNFLFDANPDNIVARDLLPVLDEARRGLREFTVILRDKAGGSCITHDDPSKVEFEECKSTDPSLQETTKRDDS
jgi:zinc finger protein